MSREKTIGIIGDGQLARMQIPDANRLGYKVKVMGPTQNSPAQQMGAEQLRASSFKDEAATRELAATSRFLTFETEHVNTPVLMDLSKDPNSATINPSPETVAMINDKSRQKAFLTENGIPVAPFQLVEDKRDILDVAKEFSYPILLKSRFNAYDGQGNALVKREEDVNEAMAKLKDKGALYVEKYVPFKKELAIMIARSTSDEIAVYPVVQTVHENNICHTVFAPAPIDKYVYKQAEELGRATMEHLKGAGVFGIEMFMTEDRKVLVNEIAPRVHNSGHYTIEACDTSQFEQHIRAITGLPLGDPEMIVPAAVMVNILGRRTGQATVTGLESALEVPHVGVHIYGKAETKPERKMGHITVWAKTLDEAYKNAQKARERITI